MAVELADRSRPSLDRFSVDRPEPIDHVKVIADRPYTFPSHMDFSQAHRTADERLC
jgi:hypothetical protein